MTTRGTGTGRCDAPPETGSGAVVNDLAGGLLTVFGVLAGIAALLYLLAALDPTNVRRKSPSGGAVRVADSATRRS